MNTPLPAVTAALILAISGCSAILDPEVDLVDERTLVRHLEIEVEDLERGLPCRVIDRRTPDARDVLWRAEFEAGFCRQKAEETRLVLQARGWACRPTSDDERRDAATRPNTPPFVVATWRCLEGLRPAREQLSKAPPVPTTRPIAQRSPAPSWGNEPLRAAVKRDLSTIGQDEVGGGTTVDAALGDLDGDDIDDAIVILTREAAGAAPHRMLMAYLQNGDAYNLVDVWILEASGDQGDELDLKIDDGAVHLGNCCEDHSGPTVLVLDDRKLAYADDG